MIPIARANKEGIVTAKTHKPFEAVRYCPMQRTDPRRRMIGKLFFTPEIPSAIKVTNKPQKIEIIPSNSAHAGARRNPGIFDEAISA